MSHQFIIKVKTNISNTNKYRVFQNSRKYCNLLLQSNLVNSKLKGPEKNSSYLRIRVIQKNNNK